MDIETELEMLKKSIINLQVCINDIHNRISQLEPKKNNSEHYFYDKTSEGTWTVKCSKTGGSFSTALWNLEKEQKQTCPCCGEQVKRLKRRD